MTTAYAELHATSNFTFLEGASHPQELVFTAAALGYRALALTDRNSLAGVVRAHVAAKQVGLKLVVGARLAFTDAPELLCLPTDRAAYGRLAQLLTLGRRRAPKGECHLCLADLDDHADGQIFIILPPDRPDAEFTAWLRRFNRRIAMPCYLTAHYRYRDDDGARINHLATIAETAGTPLVATNNVLYHSPARRALQDVLTCIREHCTLDDAGLRLAANAERHLKPPEEMVRLFAARPEAVARTVEIAAACAFSLDSLAYEYPDEIVPEGETPQSHLTKLTEAGAAVRYPDGVPAKVRRQIDHELALIEQLGYAPYFLTVYDIVSFANRQAILCQGRGSAANSAVCYCLGITAVDPNRVDLLFERFISAARDEPPDIDVDFEHERREEVIQYIYAKYGRERVGLAATVISYRARSAIREVGKALGLSVDTVGALAGSVWGRSSSRFGDDQVRELGLDPSDRRLRMALDLAGDLIGFPRHLSQHVGGFVMTRGPLSALVPIENAAMDARTVIQWDKDDIDALGILKIDVLGLGMLSCIRKALALLARHHDRPIDLAGVPAEDPAVYDMLCKADSIGVFQVESRAQMSMLPRLKPRCFYDLVIEVAIVRPGPIQGDMVHPYLRRRNGEEAVRFPSEDLRMVLGKTMGVPLFQEQAMRIAVVAAGFTPTEADALRRAMATFRKTGLVHGFRDKLIGGMVARGYDPAFAERCFSQIEGFGEYGFPESHAASFALLVYVSAWLKCHYPAAFAAALINSQPMGFYAPAQIVRDARDHGVAVLPVDINHSLWDCTLEPAARGDIALRLGFRLIKGFREDDAAALVAARADKGYRDVDDLWCRSGLAVAALERLARADAFTSLAIDRRQALWAIRALGDEPLPLFAAADRRDTAKTNGQKSVESAGEQSVKLPAMTAGEAVVEDYRVLRLTLKQHPLALLRQDLAARGIVPGEALASLRNGRRVRVAGLVLVRQRPGSAKGVIFATLEDETGVANIIVWPDVFARYRRIILSARLLGVEGWLQREGLVIHVVARRLVDLSGALDGLDGLGGLGGLGADAGGLAPGMAHADAVRRPIQGSARGRRDREDEPEPVPVRSRNFH